MLRYMTAGESHGRGLVGILEGLPAGLFLDEVYINKKLAMRQSGYGRGGRMQIEKDKIQVRAGVYKKVTTGAPLAFFIENKDCSLEQLPSLTKPRPGHADLAGYLKYATSDMRTILERSSARETAMRVAVGAVCELFLAKMGIEAVGHVIGIGGVKAENRDYPQAVLKQRLTRSLLRCSDQDAEKKMLEKIKEATCYKDTLGGIVEVIVFGVPAGLGSCMSYDRRLDSALAMQVMSVPSVKAVSIGAGIEIADCPGADVHDEIRYSATKGYYRLTNRAGGIEGGMSNGSPLVIRAYLKPIPTLSAPLASVDVRTKKPIQAAVERHDTCAVTAGSIVLEGAVSFEIAKASLEKFGGDSLKEFLRNYEGYRRQVRQS